MIHDSQKIQIIVDAEGVSVFWGLLAYGFKIEVRTGCSLFDLLCRQIGIDETYLADRVRTIFLNGQAVDDPAGAIVSDQSAIALSAAMPGLAGAVFRKGGIFSSMRASYGKSCSEIAKTDQPGVVIVKLFNQIAFDLGAGFLKKGILLNRGHFIRYVEWKRSQIESVCRHLTIDDKKYSLEDVLSVCRPDKDVFLTINAS